MPIAKPQNANASVISVTTTAAGLFDLINTAGSTSDPLAGYDDSANLLMLNVESGELRLLYGVDPTSAKGKILKSGIHIFEDVNLSDIRLISTSGTASASVLIGNN